MRKLLAALLLITLPAWADIVCSGTANSCGGATEVSNGGTALTANTVPKATGANTLGNSTITDDGTTVTINTRHTFKATMTGASLSNNFFNTTATLPSSTSAAAIADLRFITSAGSSAQPQYALVPDLLAGYTGNNSTGAIWALGNAAGTATTYMTPITVSNTVGNFGILAQQSSNTAGANLGVIGTATNATGNSIGVEGFCDAGSICNGVLGISTGGTVRNGGYFGFRAIAADTSAAIMVDNSNVASPLAFFRDNGAALPTTGATATVTVQDGASVQLGNSVLTSATMTAETQGLLKDTTSSYTWSNAQVVALGGTTAGDITVATLPAKTQVLDALVIITGQGAGTTTLTVSLGDAIAGTPFINYVVASDAKAAAGTVYGDAVAERGTAIDTEFWYLPSYSATTLVTAHFISTGANLSSVTGSTGRIILTTRLLP